MSRLRLNLACWNYDRTRALADGLVQPDGIDLNYINLEVEETFFRMLRNREFEVAEMSLSSYTVSLGQEKPPFIAIPIFPSRFFRHSCIFVSAKSGIREPKDLIGCKMGVPEYQMTAPVWIRGILQDEYGVAADAVDYYTGGEEQPGREEKLKLSLPANFRMHAIGPDKTLSQMLAEGEIDALQSARAPSTLHSRPTDVKRLFENYTEIERAYYRRTKIFPIMHTVVIRRDVYEANPWVAQSLCKAFTLAQRHTYEGLMQTAALSTMLPWLVSHVEETRREMGDDWWAYGFAANRHVLDTFLRYHHEQGLSRRRLAPEDLFAPESLEAFKI
jgi:4,5-dihydroxyphthalate decarboxylase